MIARMLSRFLDWIEIGWIPFPGLLSPERRAAFRSRAWSDSVKASASPESAAPYWFHAASAGELEMLMPLIDDLASEGTAFCVTSFSVSGLPGIGKLKSRARFAGLSPRESEWESAFRNFGTRVWVVSKYDLWPGALIAARKLGIRVVVVNAEDRSSIRWISRIFNREALPELVFFANTPRSAELLGKRFPLARVEAGSDPRYERVARRIAHPPGERVRSWRERMEALPGPVGLVGSAWRADLQVLLEEPDRIPGGLVVVPHDLSPENLDGIRSALELALPGRYLLVDEMGLLVELYPSADWACVGGGFHRGIHSTVEPAVAGLPVICGPKHADRFPETGELVEAGILTVCVNSEQIHAWLAGEPWKKERRLPFLEQKRQSYVHLLESCRSIR